MTELYEHDECYTRVELGEVLGKGAYGIVYEGKYWPDPNDRDTYNNVAIKVIRIRPQARSTYSNQVAYSLFDGLVSAFLASKNCPVSKTIKNLSCTEPTVDGLNEFMVIMELIPGEDLRKYDKSQLSMDTKLSITKQILEGFKCMHSNLIFHRDIKLENIMLDLSDPKNAKIKIIDFGLCCVDNSEEFDIFIRKHLNQNIYNDVLPFLCIRPSGDAIGAPLYVPPESSGIGARGEYISVPNTRHTKELRDAFAVGCLLYELWQKDIEDISQDFPVIIYDTQDLKNYYKNTLKGNYPPLIVTNKSVPDNIRELISKLMEYNYYKRITIDEALDMFNGTVNKPVEAASSTLNLGTPIDTRQDIDILAFGTEGSKPFELFRHILKSKAKDGGAQDENTEMYKIEHEDCLCIFEINQTEIEEWKSIIEDNEGITSIFFFVIDSTDKISTLKSTGVAKSMKYSNLPIYVVDRNYSEVVKKYVESNSLNYIHIPSSHHRDDYKIIQAINNSFDINLRI